MQNKTGKSRRQGRNTRTLTALAALAALAALTLAAGCGSEEVDDPIHNATQRISCSSTADCKAVGGQCQASVCKADNECKTDADCASGQVCHADKSFGGLCGVKGATPAPGPVWTCAADADCPASQQCKAGACVPPPPPKPSAEVCDNGKDDDQDGLTDCKDLDCEREAVCQKTPPPPTKPSSCDVLKQNCSTAGYRCWPGGEYAKDGLCYPSGPMKAGDACKEPPVDGPQACGKGLVCVAVDSASTPVCRGLCSTSADCAKTEACYKLSLGTSSTKDYGVCAKAATPPPPPPPPPCDVFKQTCSASGTMCVPQEKGANTCVSLGSGAVGSVCASASACSPTLMCAELVGTSGSKLYFGFGDVRGGTCLALCNPAAPTCASGLTCSPILSGGITRTDIGVCAK
jgi:hypothetical protein